MINIGQNIKKIRESKGMLQEELAQKMGYASKSSIAKIEAGDRDFPTSKLQEFADALNVSVMDLTTENAEDITIIARHLDQVPEADKKRVMKAIANTIDLFIEDDDNKGD